MNKKNNDNTTERIILVATLYYKEKLSQQEIAQRLGVSRPWISKLLKKAEDMGLVKIEIQSPVFGNEHLEKKLHEIYPNTDIRIIDTSDNSQDYLAMAAVHFFVSKIQPSDTIGIGWGNAVSRFVNAMIPLNYPETKTVPLAGSFGTTFETLPNYNSIKLAEKIGGQANVLHIPAYCKSQEEYKPLINNEETQRILSMGEHADILIVGIGTFSSSFLTKNQILTASEQQELYNSNAVGDIILQFIDEYGEPIKTEVTERLIHANIYISKKNVRHIIGIAQGKEKVKVLQGVLKKQLVDTLFIDIETAHELLYDNQL